jgi:hypothetical protein
MPKVTPLDALRPSSPRVSSEVKEARMAICHACEHLKAGVCGKCFCVMKVKTTLANAECPIHLWAGELENSNEDQA